MHLPSHKTKIVCTVGPASRDPLVLEHMIRKGMNVARLNFSHGDLAQHARDIRTIRKTAKRLKRVVDILIDLPGVKMRVGKFPDGPVMLKAGSGVTLTTRNVPGNVSLVPVQYKQLPQSVSKDSVIFLSDGFIQLKVVKVEATEIVCRVLIGGPISSHKGINLPGAKILVDAITRKDLGFIDFGLSQGVHTFGLSFVEEASDIDRVRQFVRKRKKPVHLVAKIERREALENLEEILLAADAVMIARGDLGIEIPPEQVPIIQKKVIRKANLMGRPVITATQMLGSMTKNVRPTRAEVNDVANAILDGTDAVMLSEETAVGDYPVETVDMMSKIAVSAEHHAVKGWLSQEIREEIRTKAESGDLAIPDVISLNAVRASEKLSARYIIVPTLSGSTARRISRLKPHCWIIASTCTSHVCQFLNLSYGMYPFATSMITGNHAGAMVKGLKQLGLVHKKDILIIAERRLSKQPGETDSMAVMTVE